MLKLFDALIIPVTIKVLTEYGCRIWFPKTKYIKSLTSQFGSNPPLNKLTQYLPKRKVDATPATYAKYYAIILKSKECTGNRLI